MIPTSDNYKDLVYGKGQYAKIMRQFLPYALVKIVDVSAQGAGEYSATSEAFYSQLEQLMDEIFTRARAWGVLEDGQFLLNGVPMLMPDTVGEMTSFQNGWQSENMSDASGVFQTPEVLTCNYRNKVTTIGRVLYFDPSYDNVPTSFDLVYYRTGVEVARDEVRNNTSYMYTSAVGAVRFDQLQISFHATSKPYRRIHLLDDIPGIYFEFNETQIISMTVTQEVDVYSEEIVTGEAEMSIQNTTKLLDILNNEGLNKYLQRYQPIDLYLNAVFPDLSQEKVHIGYWSLASWKADNTNLEAVFTVRDPTAKLSRNRYLKGVFPEDKVSLYDLAVEVLEDAGIPSYHVAEELKQIYTKGTLPLETHKECLRRIAQAGMSVVVPTLDGGIDVKFMSPLIRGYNKLANPSFEDSTSWTLSNATLSEEYIYAGMNSILFGAGSSYMQQNVTTVVGHQYYLLVWNLFKQEPSALTGDAGLYVNDVLKSPKYSEINFTETVWNVVSCIFEADSTSSVIKLASTYETEALFADAMMLLDLTEMYGAGKEPPLEWCDSNLRFVADSMLYPPHTMSAPEGVIDYATLSNPPDVTLKDPVSKVSVYVFEYTEDVTEMELYNNVRTVRGTETFDIEFDMPCRSCTITATHTGTQAPAAIKTQQVYAQSAHLTIQANGDVQIIVKGKPVISSSSVYSVDSDIDKALIEDAETHEVQNALVTDRDMGEDLVSFTAYWDSRRNQYAFDWRQDPAVEVLDLLQVQDAFDNNNTILHTQRDLDYTNGALTGSSEGVC